MVLYVSFSVALYSPIIRRGTMHSSIREEIEIEMLLCDYYYYPRYYYYYVQYYYVYYTHYYYY